MVQIAEANNFLKGSSMTIRQRAAPWRTAALALAFASTSFSVFADPQADRIEVLEKKLERSLKLIDQLASRINELEKKAKPESSVTTDAASSAPPASSARAVPTLASLQDEVNQINDGLSKRGFDFGLPVHGFADVQAATSSRQDSLRLKGFNAGTLDLYLTPQFGDRVRSLIEIALEYEPEGKKTAVDMERLQLGYTISDELTFWLGRFHTPFGLWNTSFHHGAQLQTSIYRPRFIEFEDRGGIIPAHSVGFWASGKTDLGVAKVTYDAYLSNGPSIRERELDFNPFTDDSDGKMVGFNIGVQPSGPWRGVSLGLHGFTSKVGAYAPSDSLVSRTRLRMAGAYAAYDSNDWEVFAELYRFSNRDDPVGSTHKSTAGFVHAGRTLGAFTPYVRYERASLDPNDVYFAAQRMGQSYTRYVIGSRYALDAKSSVKLELSRSEESAANQLDDVGGIIVSPRSRYNRAAFQYSIAF